MYLRHTKAAIVEALEAVFDSQYPYEFARNLRISIEYPIEEVDFPGIWVNYEDRKPVERAGIGHEVTIVRDDGSWGQTTKWRFEGQITVTIVAMTSQERDILYDEMVRIVGFAYDKRNLSDFRQAIESNDFIGMNINFDTIQPGGNAEAPGTPWGTQEVIYEKSLGLEVQGEFVGDPDFQELVLLRQVRPIGWVPPQPEPPFTGNPPDDVLDPGGVDDYDYDKGWR